MSILSPEPLSPSPAFREGYAVLDNPNLPLNISSDQLPRDRDLWKTDRACVICTTGFKIMQHKYRCKFCYRGVCNKCSRHTFLHPELGVLKRCCNSCFVRFIGSNLREELDGKIYESQGRINVIEDQLFNMQRDRAENGVKTKELETDVKRMRLKLTHLDQTYEKDISGLKTRIVTARRAKDQTNERRGRISQRIQVLRSESEAKLSEKKLREETLQACEEQNAMIKSRLSVLQDKHGEYLRMQADRSQSTKATKETLKEVSFRCDSIEKLNLSTKSVLEETATSIQRIDQQLKASFSSNDPGDIFEMKTSTNETESEETSDWKSLQQEFAELQKERESLQNRSSERLTFTIKTIRDERETLETRLIPEPLSPERSCCTVF